jgi:von Willebrand factor type A domain
MNEARSWLALALVAVSGCIVGHGPGDGSDATSRAEPASTPGADMDAASGPMASLDAGGHEAAADAATDQGSSDGPADAGMPMDAETTADAADARPPRGVCEAAVLSAVQLVPEVRIVLDRSQSMAPLVPTGVSCVGYDPVMDQLTCSAALDQAACDRVACASIDCTQPPYQGSVVCGGTAPSPAVDRWTPAVQGITSFTRTFQARLGFGLTVFPGDAPPDSGTGPSADICAPGSERVPARLNNAAAIARALERTEPTGATPTAAALTAVEAQVRAQRSAADAGAAPQFVVLLSDGQPTCPNARGNTLDATALAQDHALTLDGLDALLAAGVKSYVFAFVASSDVALTQAMGELARHGGTERFYPVSDTRSIVQQFDAIAPALTSCSFAIDKKPLDPTSLMVKVDDKTLELNGNDGWVIEGKTLTLQGAACATYNDGKLHRIVIMQHCDWAAP